MLGFFDGFGQIVAGASKNLAVGDYEFVGDGGAGVVDGDGEDAVERFFFCVPGKGGEGHEHVAGQMDGGFHLLVFVLDQFGCVEWLLMPGVFGLVSDSLCVRVLSVENVATTESYEFLDGGR